MASPRSRLNPWDRRDGETDQSFEAFTVYRDMGYERSLAKVAQRLGKSKALMDRWSRQHQWLIRAAAFDTHEDREHQKWLRGRRRESERRTLAAASTAMGVAAQSLQTIAQQLSTDKGAALKPADAARLLEVASRMERLVLGQSTENVSVAADEQATLTGHVVGLSDEDRRARMVQLQRELDARLKDTEDPDAAAAEAS